MSVASIHTELTAYGPQSTPFRGDLAAARQYCQQFGQRVQENFTVTSGCYRESCVHTSKRCMPFVVGLMTWGMNFRLSKRCPIGLVACTIGIVS